MDTFLSLFLPNQPEFWVAIGLLLSILEVLDGHFVLLSLGMGCLLTAVFAFLGVENLNYLLGICTVCQVLVFLMIRPIAMRSFQGKETPTNTDALIGQIGIVTKPISGQLEPGYIRLQGEEWRAIATDNESKFDVDTQVIVESMSGITVTVNRAP